MCFFPCDSFQNFLLPLNRVSVLKADISEILCFYMTYTNYMLILLKSIIFVALFIENTELLASSPRINAKISINSATKIYLSYLHPFRVQYFTPSVLKRYIFIYSPGEESIVKTL